MDNGDRNRGIVVGLAEVQGVSDTRTRTRTPDHRRSSPPQDIPQEGQEV
jgi:hypothetical protein